MYDEVVATLPPELRDMFERFVDKYPVRKQKGREKSRILNLGRLVNYWFARARTGMNLKDAFVKPAITMFKATETQATEHFVTHISQSSYAWMLEVGANIHRDKDLVRNYRIGQRLFMLTNKQHN